MRRPPPARRVAARAALVYRSTSFSSALRDRTVVLRLALGASCAHNIYFFFREVRTRLSPAFSYFTVLTACDATDSMQFPLPTLRPPQVLSGFHNYRLVLSIVLSAPYHEKYITHKVTTHTSLNSHFTLNM